MLGEQIKINYVSVEKTLFTEQSTMSFPTKIVVKIILKSNAYLLHLPMQFYEFTVLC